MINKGLLLPNILTLNLCALKLVLSFKFLIMCLNYIKLVCRCLWGHRALCLLDLVPLGFLDGGSSDN